MLGVASSHIVAVILLSSFLPGAKADCWVDTYVYLSKSHLRGLVHSAQLVHLIIFLISPTL